MLLAVNNVKVRRIVEYKETKLDKEWRCYVGTGINAEKGNDALVLREACGGGKFAVVKLHGGCSTSSAVQVLEEIDTADLVTAASAFAAQAMKLGFAPKPIRHIGLRV